MCDPVSAVVGAVTAVASMAQGQQQAKAAKKAASQQQANAEKMYTMQEQDMNRRNAKQPNVAALMSSNMTGSGPSTALTGPQGIDPNTLYLGKNTALGQ
jgi:hypothetical protein